MNPKQKILKSNHNKIPANQISFQWSQWMILLEHLNTQDQYIGLSAWLLLLEWTIITLIIRNVLVGIRSIIFFWSAGHKLYQPQLYETVIYYGQITDPENRLTTYVTCSVNNTCTCTCTGELRKKDLSIFYHVIKFIIFAVSCIILS